MHSLFRKRGVLLIGLLALVLAAVTPTLASAKPEPGVRGRGFRLFARTLGAMTINRVYCGLTATGEVCVDSTNSSTIGGGFWPKGTADQYVFNSGLQLAGIVGTDGGPWANDTTGAFFFDARGDQQHGEQVQPIFNTTSAADNAFICGVGSFGCNAGTTDPAALAARVPQGDANANLFDPLLQGRTSASQGDVWWLSWDGNPGLLSGRTHPLGLVVETRGMGWNFPSGNEDIVYFIYTFYNITSIDAADYAAVRPGMRDILLQQANTFQQRNEATFGISLPDGGYTITDMFANFGADMDVGDAGVNYSSVNLPFNLGFTYEHSFSRFAGWDFDPAIFSAPFFAGTGFIGVKYLKSPEIAPGVEAGLTLFSNTTNGGGDLNDPRGVTQLYRYISGTLSPVYGDGQCNFNPIVDKICFIRSTSPTDMRQSQSSGPLTLGPGEFGSIVVAYIFAAPVGPNPNCGASASCVTPGNSSIIKGMANPAVINAGVNRVDSIAGFTGFNDANGDNILTQEEFTVVPGSLLGKSLTAQAVFNAKFLLPFAPDAPDFFLIPGDNQVTVMWRPSNSETNGDPFFAVASQPLVPDPNDPLTLVPNVLYDPNYRQFDVEGYRVYRGRVDAPNSLRLLAQFDYAGTVISDFAGQVNPSALCAPEIGVTLSCPVVFDPITPGVGRVAHVDIPLVGSIIQVKLGERTGLASGEAIVLIADTALTGRAGSCAPSACPQLNDTGVPFVYLDATPRNNFRYFYTVTAFDVNSFQSGPSNLESPRITKPVTPVRPASNYQNEAILDAAVYGRGEKQTDLTLPDLDPSTGIFSKKMPASNGWDLALAAFVKQVIAAPGAITVRLDSMILGSAYNNTANQYWTTVLTATDSIVLQVPIVQDQFNGENAFGFSFTALSADAALASRYGGDGSYTLAGQLDVHLEGNYYTSAFGRGCVNGAPGFTGGAGCDYQGARWFDGPSPTTNETFAHPNGCTNDVNTLNFVICYNNAGALTGVTSIFEEKSYFTTPNVWRNVEGVLGGAARSADYNVYWGAGGVIDSIIDISNNVVVPFAADLRTGSSWGVLNQSAATVTAGSYDQRAELTVNDMGCVPPFPSFSAPSGQLGCVGGPTYVLSNTVVPGPIVLWSGTTTNARSTCTPGVAGCGAVAANAGFVMYIPGHLFIFELTGGVVPAQGTVWSLRDYIGAIRGGGSGCAFCTGGADGPYIFAPQTRTMAAVGAEVRFTFDVTNQVNPATDRDLSNVHTVPDPYYVTNEFEQSTDTKIIKFVNLPQDAIIRIYSSSGVLVRLIEHHTTTFGGEETWDVRNRNNQVVASGVYFYHVEAGDARKVGRFTVVNFAQ